MADNTYGSRMSIAAIAGLPFEKANLPEEYRAAYAKRVASVEEVKAMGFIPDVPVDLADIGSDAPNAGITFPVK